MNTRRLTLILIAVGIIGALLIAASLVFTPTNTSPAFDAALQFVEAVARGDETAALAHVSPDIRAYAAANCPDGLLSACIDGYTPSEWGAMQRAVYRRAAPNTAQATAWDIDIISYYAAGTGASGVCIYARAEWFGAGEQGVWLVTRYAGFVHCGDPESRDMANSPGAPNRVPPNLDSDAARGVTITDDTVITGAFRVDYPVGWRVITSAADAPIAVTLVAPGDCEVIVIGVESVAAPDLPACADVMIAPVTQTFTIDGAAVTVAGVGRESESAAFTATLEQVIGSIASAPA
ncbi:MAG: hypothetical protein SGJ24_19085 [Chloroflexota bacterium]|nr:hypothetical protein [Chloroflexota bacterium]